MKLISLYEEVAGVFYHGTPDERLIGYNGIHVGTYEAAKEALEARIGIPANGEWDGKREYGKTLLAGRERLINSKLNMTGYNVGKDLPIEDYYPADRKTSAYYSNMEKIPFNCKPVIIKVKIIGRMGNTLTNPYSDDKANKLILRQLSKDDGMVGYYYINDSEDEGSISAVVPNKSFLQKI